MSEETNAKRGTSSSIAVGRRFTQAIFNLHFADRVNKLESMIGKIIKALFVKLLKYSVKE